ncbi:MAG TPA: glycosyltransferase family 87 protein [Terricaulis sp.]|nr:glycosyltransferase family 87 protein [Terricaulis sp.]
MSWASAIGAGFNAQWRDPRGRIVLCAGAAWVVLLGLNYLMQQLSGWSAFWPMRVWLSADAEVADSWRVMQQALDWIRTHPDGGLYRAIFFDGQNKFQYAPTSLLPMVALEALGLTPDAKLLNAINWVFIGFTAAAVACLTHLLLGRAQPQLGETRLAAAALAGAAVLSFYPVMMAYHLGQLQVWINMLFALACLAWVGERRALAGVLIGLICLLKPQFGLFALWALLRREWRFLAALCVTGALGLLISILLFGFKNHLEYLSVLQFLSQHGESYWANQSLNGLLHRLVGHGVTEWVANDFPPFDPFVYGGSLIATIAILGLALSARRGAGPEAALMDFMLAALAFTAASPIAWEHHYGVLAPMFAALFAVTLAQPQSAARSRWLAALAVCFIFAANCFAFTLNWAEAPFNIVQSYLFFAALGMLAMLWRRTQAPRAA